MNNGTEPINNYLTGNERYKRKQPMVIDIDEDGVERVANRLVDLLGYSDSRPYYCKVARLLPEATLERLAVTAKESGKHPGRLFTYLTKKEIRRLGVNRDE
jgi:hypothetical protein